MIAALQAAVSVAVAGVLAVTAYAGQPFLAAAISLTVIGVAIGWPALLSLPHPRGTAMVIMLCGGIAIATAWAASAQARPLSVFAGLLALAVLAAFGHELARRDGRPRLVESLTGTFAGEVVVVLAASWLLLPSSTLGPGGVVVAAAGAGAARVAVALPWPDRIGSWVSVVAGAGGAVGAAMFYPDVQPVPALVIGASVAGVVAAVDRLLATRPQARASAGLLAAALAPLAAAGPAAYAAARLVGA